MAERRAASRLTCWVTACAAFAAGCGDGEDAGDAGDVTVDDGGGAEAVAEAEGGVDDGADGDEAVGDGAADCSADGECNTDPSCVGVDPDCVSPCGCDYFRDVCEAVADATAAECPCDVDCAAAGDNACGADGHCDTWCDPGGVCVDPDCGGGGPCER